MEHDIQRQLMLLNDRISHLRELLEWQRLSDEERARNRGHGLRPTSDDAQDIATAYGAFISLALDLQAALDRTVEAPANQLAGWHNQLRQLVDQCESLRVPDRFINR